LVEGVFLKKMKKEKIKITKALKRKISSGIVNYPVGDFLIRLKNAAIAKKHDVVVKKTLLIYEVAKLLQKSGYINDIKEDDGNLYLKIAYIRKEPLLLDIRLVSKPGLRVYKSAKELEAHKGPSFIIISTSRGLMTNMQAVKANIGGEVIAEVI
jgi:small subunit ribosomal protein S8